MKLHNFQNFGEVALAAIRLNYDLAEKRNYIGISQIGYCNRKLFYDHTSENKPSFSDKTIANFYRGHANHDYLPSILWAMRGELPGYSYIKSEKDVEIQVGNYKLRGHADHIAKLNDEDFVIDWKFVNSTARITGPHQHNVDQLFIYAHGLGIKKIQVVYFDNADFNIFKTFTLDVDPLRVSFLLNKYRDLMLSIENKVLPQRAYSTPEDSEWECDYCPFYAQCWQSERKFADKKDEVVTLDSEVETEYVQLSAEKKILEEKLDALKEEITASLDGRKASGDLINVSYIIPKKPVPVIDPLKVEELARIDEEFKDLIDTCFVEPEAKNPYYKITPVKRRAE